MTDKKISELDAIATLQDSDTFAAVQSATTKKTTLSAITTAIIDGSVTLPSQTANTVFAGPASGADAAPTWRALVPADFGTDLDVQFDSIGVGVAAPGTSGDIDMAGTLYVGSTQTIYNAEEVDGFTGSLFIGNGGGSLSHTTGSEGYSNTALGLGALRNNTTGYSNTALGLSALLNNTTGYHNTALGLSALRNNTTGYHNTALGLNALLSNTTGYYNTALGLNALLNNTTGYSNTALGLSAGRYVTAGTANETSNTSVYLGYDTRASADGNTNEIVIGYNARGNGSNTVTLGNSSITKTILRENVGIGTTNPSTGLDVAGNAIEFEEMTAPGAGAANTARLYAVDNGSGKTQLVVVFSSGAAQVLATQP